MVGSNALSLRDPALAAIEKGEPGRDVHDRHRLAVERSGLSRGLAGQLPDRSGEHTAPACFVAMNHLDERLQLVRRFLRRAQRDARAGALGFEQLV
jgi:hypothetical protein